MSSMMLNIKRNTTIGFSPSTSTVKTGISLDDCEIVSNAVDPILDEADPIEQAYYLSVSSVGIDRPLKKDKDFQRSIGKTIDVKLYAPLKRQKGVLRRACFV